MEKITEIMEEYKIYHIPGIKIGCSTQIDIRIDNQGFDNYEVLEIHTDIYEASKRESELQKKYGYSVDWIPYHKTIEHQKISRNKKSRLLALKSRGDKNIILSEMGKIGGKKTKESGKLLQSAILGGKIAGKIRAKVNNSTILKCPKCGMENNVGNSKRWHFDNCKRIN
jgi:hypothetical protein